MSVTRWQLWLIYTLLADLNFTAASPTSSYRDPVESNSICILTQCFTRSIYNEVLFSGETSLYGKSKYMLLRPILSSLSFITLSAGVALQVN